MSNTALTIGLPRMQMEPGERRGFLPRFIGRLEKLGAHMVLEQTYGSGMGFTESDYAHEAPSIRFVSHEETFQQDYVLVLRCPSDADLRRMRPGACLISMLHYPTRPKRVELLRSLKLEAISLDSIKDDSGRRLIENLRSVAWNGIETAFKTLRQIYPPPGFTSPHRNPIRLTLLGAGAVGSHVVQAAVRYGDDRLRQSLFNTGVPGVKVEVVDYDLTHDEDLMREILARTDILVDATQRPDASLPVIPNAWIAVMPSHAVLLDLSVDPYSCDTQPMIVKGIEGIPQGNLDQYVFAPQDEAFDRIPECIPTLHRRHSVSCYSWPGIYPKQCMDVYGRQLSPVLRNLIEKGGIENIDPHGRFFERAIARAQLSHWELATPEITNNA